MKKFCMLFTLVSIMSVVMTSMAFAADPTYSTQVTFTGPEDEEYLVTVPATLATGASGTVTVRGQWASVSSLKVSAPTTVTLSNGNAAENKTVNITFTEMNISGNDIAAIETTNSVAASDISNALFGTWQGTLVYNIVFTSGLAT